MPSKVFILPSKSGKPVSTSKKDDQHGEKPEGESVVHARVRITAPPRSVEPTNDWDEEDFHFRYRPIHRARPPQKHYQQALIRISEEESTYPTFSAIVTVPIVKSTDEAKLSMGEESGLSSKRKESNDATTVQGQTLLHLAAILGHEEIMRILIGEISRDVPLVNTRGQTPLLSAIEAGSTSAAIFLMIQDPALLTCQDNNGSSVFHYATENDNPIILNRAISLLKQLNSSAGRLTVSGEHHHARCARRSLLSRRWNDCWRRIVTEKLPL